MYEMHKPGKGGLKPWLVCPDIYYSSHNILGVQNKKCAEVLNLCKLNKTGVERRQTLGHLRSINPNMINHVPQQSPLIF